MAKTKTCPNINSLSKKVKLLGCRQKISSMSQKQNANENKCAIEF